MVYETVPASEIKRRGIGMLDESLKRGPVFIISHNNKWEEIFKKIKPVEDIVLIHNNGIIGGYSEDELSELSLVKDKTIPLEAVKKDRQFQIDLSHKMLDELEKLNRKPQRTIENELSIEYGFMISETTFINVYENGTALIGIDGKYYGYQLENYEVLNTKWDEFTASYMQEYEDPYYSFK